MKKQNTWMTIALGALVTVTVAAVTIVWSGSRTKENPEIGLESTNELNKGSQAFTEAIMGEDTPSGEKTSEEQVINQGGVFGTWEPVESYPEIPRIPETRQAVENDLTEEAEENAAPAVGEQVYSLNFSAEERMAWPVQGNVIQYYSMDTTVYFPTLKQYKCSPAIEIQSEAGTAVTAPANARISEIGEDARIGLYVKLELGNDYQVVLGQLTDICVSEGDYVAQGARIGTVAAPTRYYVVEGDNLYFQMLQGDQTVDPLDYLN